MSVNNHLGFKHSFGDPLLLRRRSSQCRCQHRTTGWSAWCRRFKDDIFIVINLLYYACWLRHKGTELMFLWPCIVSKAWGKKTNKMQQNRWFIVNNGCWLLTLSQHVSGIFMPIFRRNACGMYLLVVLDVAGCGTVVLRWGCDHCEGCRTATFTVITPST